MGVGWGGGTSRIIILDAIIEIPSLGLVRWLGHWPKVTKLDGLSDTQNPHGGKKNQLLKAALWLSLIELLLHLCLGHQGPISPPTLLALPSTSFWFGFTLATCALLS